MIGLAVWMVAQVSSPAVEASVADAAQVKQRAQPVLDRYYEAVRACGARPPFKPTISVSARDGVIHYDQQRGQLVLYPWSVVGGDMRSYAAKRAGPYGGDARKAYEGIFNDLLVAHELGHWLQGFQPERRTREGRFDNWFSEWNANALMVAYWREHSSSRIAAERRIQEYVGPDAGAPNPIPPPTGTSLEDFFTGNTMKIVQGGGYGWYQALMTQQAMAERPAPTFCHLVAEWLPLKD